MNESITRVIAGLAVLLLTINSPVSASDGLTATLDGRTIGIDKIGSLHCHDFDFPIIRCFNTGDELEADVADRSAFGFDATVAAVAVGYVTVYQDALYEGASMILSTDQPWLSSIGWNDRISSFKSHGASGAFQEHSPSGGFYFPYGPTTQTNSLNSTTNDKFSSFTIN